MSVSGIKSLRNAFLVDNGFDSTGVEKLIDAAKDGGKISAAEKAELAKILEDHEDKFAPDAKDSLSQFLGEVQIPTLATYRVQSGDTLSKIARAHNITLADLVAGNPQITNPDRIYADQEILIPGAFTPQTSPDPVPAGPVATGAAELTDLALAGEAFTKEYQARRDELDANPSLAFALFAEYGGRLKALKNEQPQLDPKIVDKAVDDLLEAGKNSSAKGYDNLDTDKDTVSDLKEAALGRNPDTFDRRIMEADHKVWTTTYWPMAGDGNTSGDPGSHLWAKDGALDKLDKLLLARGMDDRAMAMEYERKPALNWLIGERTNKGHYIPEGMLLESDAEITTGIDFDGDGKLTSNVKVDFLDARGNFAPVHNRDVLEPKLKVGDELIDLTRKPVLNDDGSIKKFKFYKPDGTKLTARENRKVFYTHAGGDGDVDGSMDVGWWGSCDKVALAGILFKEPTRDVTIDGVTFSKQDILGLLTVLANSQAKGTDLVGARYDERPDIVTLNNGHTIRGKITSEVEFRTPEMDRREGDYMTLTDIDTPVTIRTPDGNSKTYPANEIRSVAREDMKDMSPVDFHQTMVKWLGEDKRPAAMDRDSGSHVWNYNFWKADLKEGTKLEGPNRPEKPGHKGPAGDGEIVHYTMDVFFGESSHPKTYDYWVEYDITGEAVNGGWNSSNPDFLWRPSGFADWSGHNARNPFVDPKLVKEIYMKSIEE